LLASKEATMLKTLILFCLIGVEPGACTWKTAVRRVHGQDASLTQCAMSGELVAAAVEPHAIFGRQYIKVVCAREAAER
jgi:hypothetical protein